MNHDDVKEDLLKNDKVFRTLFEEHRECELQLEAIHSKPALSPEDESEAKRIKIHKLHLKDRMESMIRSHSTEAASA